MGKIKENKLVVYEMVEGAYIPIGHVIKGVFHPIKG